LGVEEGLRNCHFQLSEIEVALGEFYREQAERQYEVSAHGGEGQALCESLLHEIEVRHCETVDEVTGCASFAGFALLCEATKPSIPPKLLEEGTASARSLIGFIQGKANKLSPEQHRASFLESKVKLGAEAGPLQASAKRRAAFEKDAAIVHHSPSLAASDHLAIQCVAGLPDGSPHGYRSVAVVSQNVMERVKDGISVYLGSQPIRGGLGKKGQTFLMDAMRHPTVLALHAENVARLCEASFARGCRAVCLQVCAHALLSSSGDRLALPPRSLTGVVCSRTPRRRSTPPSWPIPKRMAQRSAPDGMSMPAVLPGSGSVTLALASRSLPS